MPLDAGTLRWAYEELPEFPEDDGHRYEYIAGDLVVTRFSSIRHQEVLGRLLLLMQQSLKAHSLRERSSGGRCRKVRYLRLI